MTSQNMRQLEKSIKKTKKATKIKSHPNQGEKKLLKKLKKETKKIKRKKNPPEMINLILEI